MDCKQTLIAAITGISLLASPAMSGGPVLMIEDTTEAVAPDRDNRWIVPMLVLLGIAVLTASGGGDDEAPGEGPQPCVKVEGGC